jgi:hypothetical protein
MGDSHFQKKSNFKKNSSSKKFLMPKKEYFNSRYPIPKDIFYFQILFLFLEKKKLKKDEKYF